MYRPFRSFFLTLAILVGAVLFGSLASWLGTL